MLNAVLGFFQEAVVTDGLPAVALARGRVSRGTMRRKPHPQGRLLGRDLELADSEGASWKLGLDQSAADRITRQLDTVAHAELVEDVLAVALDRLDADEERGRYLL